MTQALAGKSAAVIGGMHGIGRAIALALACAGAGAVASSRSGDAASFTTGQILVVDGGLLASGVNQ
ncbi:MAG: hypothetical protein FWD64_05255 [Acidobacteriaceae bacterium]|nr:hypothetical protein [Acidobacteriaceae bacterium]